MLSFENVIDPAGDSGDQNSIIKGVCQQNYAIEPVRSTFPPLGIAADPGAVCHIGPELIEMPAQTVCL
jgi:hypothetical protein